LERGADGLEQRDRVVVGPPLDVAATERKEVTADIVKTQHAAFERLDNIPGLAGGAGERVDIDRGAAYRLVVALAHRRLEGPDKIEVAAFRQEAPEHQRRFRQGGDADDVGRSDGDRKRAV